MCGINGFFNYSKISISEQENLIERMNKAISHRGPDDCGIWSNPASNVYLGHQRLSILDLSERGHQPMVSPKGTAIVYNGEIYNFKILRKELISQPFFSETDTEVLLYIYEKFGHNCLDRVNGMFAFALWDEAKKELFLARDRIGIKPLYYTEINGVFAFASEIKALLSLPWIKAELDEEAFYHFLTFNKVIPPFTMFKNINKFHPGYMMVIGENGIKKYEPYWELSYSDYSSLSEEDLIDLVVSKLEESVQNRLLSDVPVGAFLSGGVDSSSIVSLMSKNVSFPVKTYSIGFQNSPSYDERVYARKISRQFGTEHFEKIVTPQDIVEFLPKIVDIFDEPLADATSIPIYFLSQLARENGTIVILTGDGADELFCGYRSWMRYVKLFPYYRLLSKFPKIIRSGLANFYGAINKGSPYYEILNRLKKSQEFYWSGARGFKESTKHSFLSKDFVQKMAGKNSYDQVLYYQKLFGSIQKHNRESTFIDWLCFMGLKDSIPNYYLYRADHLGMANSIELRVPFLDHDYVNFAISIEGKWKIHANEPKYVLKKSLEGILPSEIIYRKKQGFCVPLLEWAGDVMVNYIESNLKVFCRETGLFNENGLREQISQTRKGNIDYISMLWTIYFLMAWIRKWML